MKPKTGNEEAMKIAIGSSVGLELRDSRLCILRHSGFLTIGVLVVQLFLGAFFVPQANGQLASPDTLPVGVEQITEGRVTATISFLASDELGGRETNSKEFEIAAAYVAARFRGAGLEGIGAGLNEAGADANGGSFYHETIVPQYRVPNSVALLDVGSGGNVSPIATYGLLNAGDEAIEVEGSVSDISLEAFQKPEVKLPALTGMVRGRLETTAKGSRAISQLMRLAGQLQAAGAKALLLECEPESEWFKQGEMARLKPRLERSERVSLPILLVSPATKTMGAVKLIAPAMLREDKKMKNVIGLLRGTDPELSKQAILYSAHLDHLGTNPKLEGDGIFNGADDDATGVTAVVTLADAIGAMPQRPKRSVLFMTFWGEESGLLGSRQFVANPSWPLDKIAANINIEMIGRPEGGANGKIWMTGWRESDLGGIMSDAAKPFGVDIFEHPKFSAMLYRSSDNWSFVEKGVVAHSFSAGSLHGDYHQVTDEWERLEIPHMTKVIRGLWLGSFPLLDGTKTPQASAKAPQ
jgi:hypothetical protein